MEIVLFLAGDANKLLLIAIAIESKNKINEIIDLQMICSSIGLYSNCKRWKTTNDEANMNESTIITL